MGLKPSTMKKTGQQEEPTAQQQWDDITSTCIEIAGKTIKRNKMQRRAKIPEYKNCLKTKRKSDKT